MRWSAHLMIAPNTPATDVAGVFFFVAQVMDAPARTARRASSSPWAKKIKRLSPQPVSAFVKGMRKAGEP